MPILKAFDHVSWTCDYGYSTDGGAGPEGKSFIIIYLSSGMYGRQLSPESECQPVRCDNFMLPTVPHANITSQTEHMYEVGDIVNFSCISGYTTTGVGDEEKPFNFLCKSTGKFDHNHPFCEAIACGEAPFITPIIWRRWLLQFVLTTGSLTNSASLRGKPLQRLPKSAMLDQAIAPTMTDDIFIYELSMMASETLQRLPKTAI